jgi:type II secretory pathway predicted ATPase ExeA
VVLNLHAAKPGDLLQAILFDLSQPYEGLTEQELRLAVTGQLLQSSAGSGYPTVLLIDEAQQLTDAALEELRLLGNLETLHGAALFVLLVGQPGLREALDRPEHTAFAQRVAVRVGLHPLTVDESADYLRHQVEAAGGDPGVVFDDSAVSLFAGGCGGVPRILNQAAALAASLAADAGANVIDVEAALEALARLGLEPPPTDEAEEPDVLLHPARASESTGPNESGSGSLAETGNRREPVAARGPKQKPSRKRMA